MSWGQSLTPSVTTGDMETVDRLLTEAGFPPSATSGYPQSLPVRIKAAVSELYERRSTSADGIARRLRERADSFARDAQVLAADGDMPMAAAYRAIAEELRKAAG